MSKSNKIMIQVCLCGAGTKKAQAPTVPYTADELAEQIVACAKAGASIAHIHVREDKVVDGEMQIGYKSMSLQKFTEAVEKTRELCAKENVDIIITMEDLIEEFKNSKAYVIGVKDIMDMNFLEGELNKYFELEKAKGNQ